MELIDESLSLHPNWIMFGTSTKRRKTVRQNQTGRIGCAFSILLFAGTSALAQTPLRSQFT